MKEHKKVNQCLAAGFSLEALMETLRQRPSAKQPQKKASLIKNKLQCTENPLV